MFTKHQKRSRKTYRIKQQQKNHIFGIMEYNAGLVIRRKMMEGGAI